MRGLVIACAGALCWTACARVARPAQVPATVFAGEPVRLGADGAEWTYGDGTSGASGLHAFERSGTVTVVAAHRGEELGRYPLIVLPRPVLRAVPPDATAVLWIPAPKDAAGPMVDFCERAAGGFFSSTGAQRDPFLRYLLELSAQPPAQELAIDRDEGLAAFELPDTPVRFATVGVDDPQRALRGVRDLFAADGFQPEDPRATPLVLAGPEGERIAAFVDRGYLYLASLPAGLPAEDLKALTERIREASPAGLSGVDALSRLRARVAKGSAFAWVRALEEAAYAFDSALASLSFSPDRLELDAAIAADAPLWDPAEAPEPSDELFDAAEGAQLLVFASADPRGLGRLIDFALALRPRRAPERAELDRGGRGWPQQAPGTCAATGLRGDASFAATLDLERSLAHLTTADGPPELVADWTLLAGARSPDGAGCFLEGIFEDLFLVPRRKRSPDLLRYELDLDGRRATAGCCSHQGTLWFSTRRRGAKADPEALRARFSADAFSRGHLSVLIDVGALMRELELPAPSDSARALRGFASTFLQQLTGVDTVFIDVVPDADGGHARGAVELRPE